MPKKFVGDHFSVSLFSGTKKVWIKGGGGGVSIFSVENYLSHSADNFRRGGEAESFSNSIISGI